MTRNRLLILVLMISTIGMELHAQVRGGDLPGPLPLFPPDHWWNVDITSAPVDPNSAAYINFIRASQRLHPDFGGESNDSSSPIYGMP